jgi:uncharacterized protein YndB with AHSA1/START domain
VNRTELAVLRLERSFKAPPEEVFDAWTNPEVLRRWWAAGADWHESGAEVDLRVGGRYRLSMQDPESGDVHVVGGTYRVVERPERLVYSWLWEDGDGHKSEVSVRFQPDGDGTTVVLEHSALGSVESAERHRHGWEACIDNLATRVLNET